MRVFIYAGREGGRNLHTYLHSSFIYHRAGGSGGAGIGIYTRGALETRGGCLSLILLLGEEEREDEGLDDFLEDDLRALGVGQEEPDEERELEVEVKGQEGKGEIEGTHNELERGKRHPVRDPPEKIGKRKNSEATPRRARQREATCTLFYKLGRARVKQKRRKSRMVASSVFSSASILSEA